jgi:hypothetical protein
MELNSDFSFIDPFAPAIDLPDGASATLTGGGDQPKSIHDLLVEFWPVPPHETLVSELLVKMNGEGIYSPRDLALFARNVKTKTPLALQILESLQANLLRFDKIKFSELLTSSSQFAGSRPADHFVVLKSPPPPAVATQAVISSASIVDRAFFARRIHEWCNDCSAKNKHGVPVVRSAFLEENGSLKSSVKLAFPDPQHVTVHCELCSRSYDLLFDMKNHSLSLNSLMRHVVSVHASAGPSAVSDSASEASPKKRLKTVQTNIKPHRATVTPLPPPLAVPLSTVRV